MSSTPTAQQNSSLPNTSSFDPASNIPQSSNTFNYPPPQPSHQSSSDTSSITPTSSSTNPNTARFNSFSLPSYRNVHTGLADVAAQTPSTHNAFSASSNPSLADPGSRHLSISSTTSNYPHQQPPSQQQASSRLLSSTSTTPSSSSYTGSAAKTAGGGGGSSSAGSTGVPNLSLGQIHLLIATINDRNYEAKLKEILKITDSNMNINTRTVRKLIIDNYANLTTQPNSLRHDAKVLIDLMKAITGSPKTVKERFADVITPEGLDDKPIVQGFELMMFLNCCGLDAYEQTVLAMGFKDCRSDTLRSQALVTLHDAFPSMLEIISHPNSCPEVTGEDIAYLLHEFLTNPVPAFLDEKQALRLADAARARYKHTTVPQEITVLTAPLEGLRQQETLALKLRQYGDQVSLTEHFCQLLREFSRRKLHEGEVAEALAIMAMSPNPSNWNSGNFAQALRIEDCLHPDFDWSLVIEHLDRDDFFVEGPAGFYVLVNAIRQGTQSQDFPLSLLWGGRWKNHRTQWSLLRAYLKADDFDVNKEPAIRKIFSSSDFSNASSAVQMLAATLEGQKLISYDAVDALLYLAIDDHVSRQIREYAQNELDRAAKLTPELILCGAVQSPKPWQGDLGNIIIENLFELFFDGHPSHQLVFWRLWQVEEAWLTERLVNAYVQNQLAITRILDISQELRCLSDLLRVRNSSFVLDLAALSARREHLNLEKWLQEMVAEFGGEFWVESYRFLRRKAEAEYAQSRGDNTIKASTVSLRVGAVHTFLSVLDSRYDVSSTHPQMGPAIQDEITATNRICIQAYPRLINMGNGYDNIILANNDEGNGFSIAIDKEMQAHYRSLYAQEREIRDVVNLMKRCKESHQPHEQDLFACMVHGLFDEYDCYPNYPIHALATTSVLFGSLIRYQLIDGIPLRVALAMIYQAVRDNTTSSTMYKFGLQALVQFQDRLKEWRSYCVILSSLPGLQGTEVWGIVRRILDGERAIEDSISATDGNDDRDQGNGRERDVSTPELANGNTLPPSPEQLPLFKSCNVDPRQHSDYEDPTEDVQDKVLFIVNNVSQSNLDSKLKELREWLEEHHHQWFADYLVVNRAKLEPNYHDLYLELLDKFGHKGLANEVLRETYINIIRLLNAETTMTNNSERSHLKNLGMWLGGLTLAKDKPIKFKNISLKDLLIEGWETDRLSVVLPFVCKILEQVTKSTVFHPPNPWIMAVLRLLKELYGNVQKLNLKFEIEVLCTRLGLDVKNVEASNEIQQIQQLRERQAAREVEEEDEQSLLQLEGLSLQQQQPAEFQPMTTFPPTFSNGIVINSIVRDNRMKRLIISAIERTTHEILGPVVERSVAIATISATQLITKDFAMEPDENKMRNAAIGMARRLAGHLALVTCKEPMRLSMTTNIRNTYNQNGYTDVDEHTVNVIVNDNLEYVCRTVESAAEDEAIPQIDDALRDQYSMRKSWRERNPSQPFVAPDAMRYDTRLLPDCFRLKIGGLTQTQLNVYEDFARAGPIMPSEPPKNQPMDGYEYLPTNFQRGTPGIAEPPSVEHVAQASPPPQQIDYDRVREQIYGFIHEIQQAAIGHEDRHIEELTADHGVVRCIENVLHIIQLLPSTTRYKETIAVGIATTLCNIIYGEDMSDLVMEALVLLLKRISEFSANIAKSIADYLAREDDEEFRERMLNIRATHLMMNFKILSVANIDELVSSIIRKRKPIALQFLIRLLKDTDIDHAPIVYRADFAASFDAIAVWIKDEPNNSAALDLLNELREPEPEPEPEQAEEEYNVSPEQERMDQFEYLFVEWVTLYQHYATTDMNFQTFVFQLGQQKTLDSRDAMLEFLRTSMEYCLVEHDKAVRSVQHIATSVFIPVDALAKLMIELVKHQPAEDVSGEYMGKVKFFGALLATSVIVYNRHAETGNEASSQKVFFRLFSTLLYEIRVSGLTEHREDLYEEFALALMVLQPKFFPRFAFSWGNLMSHRYFMPALLQTTKGQETFTKLFNIFLGFMGELLEAQTPMSNMAKIFHQAALRILLVLHHDFPNYLVDYYFPIINSLSVECTQCLNLVLSALPTNQDFLDPFQSGGLGMKQSPGITDRPVIIGDIGAGMEGAGLKEYVDYILVGDAESVGDKVKDILDVIVVTQPDGTIVLDTKAINSLVLYIGLSDIEKLEPTGFNPESVQVALLQKLVFELRPYGRHVFLTSIANHLRFPNVYTLYYHNLLLHIWDVASGHELQDRIREQVSRVLVERLVVHRPHSWGTIQTLLEIFKTRAEEFWALPAAHAAPEMKNFFGSLVGKELEIA